MSPIFALVYMITLIWEDHHKITGLPFCYSEKEFSYKKKILVLEKQCRRWNSKEAILELIKLNIMNIIFSKTNNKLNIEIAVSVEDFRTWFPEFYKKGHWNLILHRYLSCLILPTV